MKPITPPSGHQFVETSDGTFTLFSDTFQETCHSTFGAKNETILHYLEGCKVERDLDPINILEVGFGLGIGFLTTFEKMDKKKKWNFLSLEIDKNLLEWFRLENLKHEFLKNLNWNHQNELEMLQGSNENVSLTILQGDARETLPKYFEKCDMKFHAIYQDAFSPKKNPTLWTKEWFSLLKGNAHPEVILSTYSASTSIRKSLHEAGWGVQKGERFGPKRTSTRAVLNLSTDEEILLHMERSPVHAISDDNLNEFLSK